MNRRCQFPVLLLAILTTGSVQSSSRTFAGDTRPSGPPAQAGKETSSPTSGMRLAWIPVGAFEMGSSLSEEGHSRSEAPHIVRITRPFHMGISEVTQGEYEKVMGKNPSAFSSTGAAASKLKDVDTSRFPVENVSWFDAIAFCNKLSEKDELKPYYDISGIERDDGSIKSAIVTVAGGDGYRLPTEAEWEYACRAGTTTTYYTGNSVTRLDQIAWYGGDKTSKGDSEQQPHRVCRKTSNSFGLHDMLGNVSEWCQDWYDYNYYEHSSTNDPPGPSGGSTRVMRGGSWSDDALHCRVAHRDGHSPTRRDDSSGFRIIRPYVQPAQAQKKRGVPPFRIVVNRRDGRTLDFFKGETYDSFDSAKRRLSDVKLVGDLGYLRIIDGNGNDAE